MKRPGWKVTLLVPLAAFVAAAHGGTVPAQAPRDLGPVVARLVDATTTDAESQALAFRALIGLGRPAVPYVVSHLGDGRRLPERSIWIRAPTGRADTQYHPWFVHDGLLAVLKEITGYSRAPLTGHLLPSQRERSVRKWVRYCEERYPAQAKVCNSGVAVAPTHAGVRGETIVRRED
ncbi:hypothetical protein [Luteibacter sp. 329MFSha]|uniref:hypothetical protein n=1 Tax=Luteibacter sp. 329MFSha TaxID=1798239 RepID=UPI0008BDC3A7|nr:hypothetical protein [Luteibacter sp. 329MFSha]SEV98928.1 hypothetical protein SAMN04515660_1570 [Luteibacter sp. 329MFSha]